MYQQIGQKLQKARQERSLSLEQVSEETHIRVHNLEALEAGKFDSLPSRAQARGFLRAYAGFLNLDAHTLLAEFNDEKTDRAHPPEVSKPKKEIFPQKKDDIDDSGNANEIFKEVGLSLKQQRELLGLSITEIERHTHIRQHYLKALEEGDLSGLPSPVQGRGMLKNYATFLGIDPDPLLLRFADGLQARLAVKRAKDTPVRSTPAKKKSNLPLPIRRLFSADILLGSALVISLLVFIFWGGIRIFAMSSDQTPTSTAPSIADVLLASPTATASLTPEPPTPTQEVQQVFPTFVVATDAESGEPIPPNVPENNVEVYVNVRQRAWMRVAVDGEVVFEGRVIPGSAYPFIAESQVEILTGNGAALQIFFNGIDLGPIGVFGQVVNRIFSPTGISTPTPTISPTPTATQPETPTPPATNTPPPGQVTIQVIP